MAQTNNAQTSTTTALFDLGGIYATPEAIRTIHESGTFVTELLARHISGDWGELDSMDRESNDRAVMFEERILSAYNLPDGERVWIITEADRSITTLLLPEEY